jgi:hypothetical protein
VSQIPCHIAITFILNERHFAEKKRRQNEKFVPDRKYSINKKKQFFFMVILIFNQKILKFVNAGTRFVEGKKIQNSRREPQKN